VISFNSFTTRVYDELELLGIPAANTSILEPRVFVDAVAEALFQTGTGLWKLAVTTPGAGPQPSPAPHTHTIVPGVITAPAISTYITSRCLAKGWLPGYGWEILRDAVSSGVDAHLSVPLTDVKDGNVPHTHKWAGLSASILEGLIMLSLSANPSLDLTNADSKLDEFVSGFSVGLVDEIETNGEAAIYIPTGTTHTHTIQ